MKRKRKGGYPDTSKMNREIVGKTKNDKRVITFLSGNRWECECGRVGTGDFSKHKCLKSLVSNVSNSLIISSSECKHFEDLYKQFTNNYPQVSTFTSYIKLPIDGEDYGEQPRFERRNYSLIEDIIDFVIPDSLAEALRKFREKYF